MGPGTYFWNHKVAGFRFRTVFLLYILLTLEGPCFVIWPMELGQRGKIPLKTKILKCMIERIQFERCVMCGVHIHHHNCQVHCDYKWKYLLGHTYWSNLSVYFLKFDQTMCTKNFLRNSKTKMLIGTISSSSSSSSSSRRATSRISLTLSRHFSLSFNVSGRYSELHLVSLHSCCMYVLASRPAFARPYVGIHWSTSLMSSSLLLQKCPACLVRLTWIVFVWEAGGRIVGAL